MAWTPRIPGRTVEDIKADMKSGIRIEPYKISQTAVYFPREQYLLISDIRRAWIQTSQMNLIGCCGKGLPVYVVRLDYGAEEKVSLTMEKKENAEKMISLLCERNPSITVEEWSREAQLAGTAPK